MKTKTLYHFMHAEHALQAIERHRLKIAEIENINDPYELLPVSYTLDQEPIVQQTRSTIGEDYGVLCYSRTWKEPLLWGHYTESGCGICLGFEFPIFGNEKKRSFLK